MNKPLQLLGFLFLVIAFVAYLVVLIAESLETDTALGLIGLLALIGAVLLLFQAIKDRLGNEEDDYYSKNVQQ
jgi:membrane protein implicated in regulation of membrane protease activity